MLLLYRIAQKIPRYLLGSIAIFLFLFLPLFSERLSVSAAVVINEIYPKEDGNEWIELYNTGPEEIKLDRWSLEAQKGEKKKFTFNASANIPPNGFLTVFQSQSGIALSDEGDEIRLTDNNNNQIDAQSFPSILGYNSSIGRSSDGGGIWTKCTVATENKTNTCPAPTVAPTAIPSPVPTNTIIPSETPSPIPTSTIALPTNIPPTIAPAVLGATSVPVPTPPLGELRESGNLRLAGWIILVLGIVWGTIVFVAVAHHTVRKRSIQKNNS